MSSARTAFGAADGDDAVFHKSKHNLYWNRCLKTFLPHYYTPNDSNRMTLAFFTLSALDVLDLLQTSTTAEDREEYAKWIYRNQLPHGGFRGSPATDLGSSRNSDNDLWDPAHVPATYFALVALAVLGDNFERVKRKECLEWLTRMQRPDGSFGQTLGENGHIEGGTDFRSVYCAVAIRWILRGPGDSLEDVPDINIERLLERVRSSETYAGGISEAPFHEAHAGFTYCATSAISLLKKPFYDSDQPVLQTSNYDFTLRNRALTLHWLLSRQTQDCDSLDEEDVSAAASILPGSQLHDNSSMPDLGQVHCAGFNGRCNKLSDTCYSFWVSGSLDALEALELMDHHASRRYLLTKTQHLVGGFGKLPGDPPDLYHSYLGLASLAISGQEGLKPFDAALCISKDAVAHVKLLPWKRAVSSK